MSESQLLPRTLWIDIAKGIAIILVVLNHTVQGIFKAELGSAGNVWNFFHDFCYSFMVPVFFFFSGWLTKKNVPALAKLKIVGSRLLYPYVLWSLIQFSILVLTQAGNRRPDWHDIPGYLVGGWMQFWFLNVLILITVADLTLRVLRVPSSVRLILAAFCAFIVGPGFLPAVAHRSFLESWIYFELGLFLWSLKSRSFKNSELWLGIGFGLIVLLSMEYYGFGIGTEARPLVAFFGILFCSSFSAIIARKTQLLARLFSVFGRYSLQIFILHIIFAAGVRILLEKSGVTSFGWHVVIGLLVGFAGPLIFAAFEERKIKFLFKLPSLPKRKTELV